MSNKDTFVSYSFKHTLVVILEGLILYQHIYQLYFPSTV